MTTRISFLAVAATLLIATACSSSNGPSLDPNKTDCSDICTAAAQCANADEAKCESNCETKADNDSSYASSVKACSDCTTTKSSCPDLLGCGSNCLSALTTD